MACSITSTLSLDCINSVGGIKTAYFYAGTWTSATEVAGQVPAIIGTGTFYEFALPKDTAFFTETINVSNTNGTLFYQGDLTIVLQKLSTTVRNQLLLLAQSRDLRIVFTDNNDNKWLVGSERGAVMSSGTIATGTAVGDLNGYTLVFQAQEPSSIAPLSDDLGVVVEAGNALGGKIAVETVTSDTPGVTTTTTTTTAP
ncbi:MAG: hypothetical protein WC124_12205 [Desulfoplanes sp.]